jgi:hypothetical protein
VDTDENTEKALIAKDTGTLFKDAYYKLKKTKMADIELQMMKEEDTNDLL